MQVSETPSTGGGLLGALDRALAKLEDFLSFIAGLIILGLMFFGTLNVLGRNMPYISERILGYQVGGPLWGYNDIVTLFMVSFAFLAISAMQRVGGHIRMELVIRSFKGRLLWMAEFFGIVIAIIVMAVMIKYSYDGFYRSFTSGDSTIDRELLTWPSKIWVPIAFSVLLARLILQAWGYARLIVWPNATPVAVPLMADVAEVAEKEIHDTFGDGEEGASGKGKGGAV